MSDASTTFQIGVDASRGKAELASFAKSVDKVSDAIGKIGSTGGGFEKLGQQIASAASGFERLKSVAGIGNVAKDIGALSRSLNGLRANPAAISSLTQLSRALSQLSRTAVPRGLGQNLQSLSAGLSNFHMPDAATINRLPALFASIAKASNIAMNPRAGAELKYFGDGLRSVASVPLANVQRLPAVLAALDKIKLGANTATGLAGLGDALRGIGSFKAPTAGNVTNLQRMLVVLESANVDKIRQLGTALHGMTLPATSFRNLTPQTARPSSSPAASSFGLSNAGTSYTNATAGMQQLRSAADSTRASVALLGAALGGLTVGKLAHDILDAGSSLLTMKRSLDTVATSSTEAGDHWQYLKGLVNQTGTSLTTAIPAFTQLATAMRALGYSVSETQSTFGGFAKYFAVMGTPIADQKRALMELREVYSMESGKAAQVLRGMSTHIPTLMADLARVTKKSSKEVHDMFHDGGIPPEVFTALGSYYDRVYGQQLPAALQHSQTQLGRFSNAWFEFKEKVFSSGFDSGLAASLQRLTGSLEKLAGTDLAQRIGSSFSTAFQTLATAGGMAANHSDSFLKLSLAIGAAVTASVGLTVIGAIVSPIAAAARAATSLGLAIATLTTPFAIPILGGVAALVALVASSDSAEDAIGKLSRTWDLLKTSFTGFADALPQSITNAFHGMANSGNELVDTLKEIALYSSIAKEWWQNGGRQPDNWRESAAKRRADMEAAIAGPKASSSPTTTPSSDFGKSLASTFDKIGEIAGPAAQKLIKAFGGDLMKEWQAESAKTAEALKKTSAEINHQGNYAENAAAALEKQRRAAEELRDTQTKLLDKLQPSNAALVEVRKNLETLDGMAGKKDGLGNTIDAARIEKLKEAAKLNALPAINPAAESIRKLTEEVGLKSRFAGDKNALADETKVLEARNAALKAGAEFTGKQEQALRALLQASRELDKGGSNPFAQWAHNVKSDSEMTADTVKSSLDDISSKISDLVVNGKGQFKNLGQAIRATFASILGDISKKLIKNGIDALMRDGIKSMSGLFGDSGKGILSAISGGKSVVNDALSGMADKAVGQMNVTAANVVINGGIGTNGVNAFGTSGAKGGDALGGISPQSIASPPNPPLGNIGAGGLSAFGSQTPASLMSAASGGGGAPLSAVMSAVKGGNIVLPSISMAVGKAGQPLGNIGVSGVTAFGSGISPTSTGVVTMALGRDGQPLGTIGRNAFAGLTPLSPITPRSTGIGTIGTNGIAGFGSQSPASILSTRTADDTMARAGIQHLDFSKAGLSGRESYAWDFFKRKGYTDADTAKIMGNLKQEGSFHPLSRNPNDAGPGIDSVGIAQWNNGRNNDLIGGRRALMERHASQMYGKPYDQLTPTEKYNAQLSNVDRELRTPRYSGALSRPDAASFGKVYEGYGDNSGATRNGYANDYLRRFGGRQPNPSLDYNATGSIASQGNQLSEQMKPAMQKVGTDLAKNIETATKATTPQITQDLSKAFKGGGQGAEGELGGLASKIQETGSAAQSAEGGLGGLIGKLGQLGGGGGGGFGGIGEALGGLFSEGGYSDSPVSAASMPASYWHGAPHYAEGTANTSGGHPAILHENEAVVPLSRGREIPVKLTEGKNKGDNGQVMNVTNLNMNLQTKDQDSFRRNTAQVMTQLQNMLGRAAARNS